MPSSMSPKDTPASRNGRGEGDRETGRRENGRRGKAGQSDPRESPPQRRSRGLTRDYEAALEVALAPALAIGLGAWADSRWETSPLLLLAGTVLGFGASGLRVVRYLRSLEKRDEDS